MSLDVFFQGFIVGEPSEHGGSEMRKVLAPHVTEKRGPSSTCASATEKPTSSSATTG
jgi:hypothetical protein